MRRLTELLSGRPPRRISNPPADLPLDQTTGAAPPYALPDALNRQIEGKAEGEVSSTLSKFRTGLSEHRTRLSEHRTDLSEHRTDLSDYRTELSTHRTTLSVDRSHLSNERTHLSYLRTAVSLISFGVTLNRFAVFLLQSNRLADDAQATMLRMQHTEQIGLGMAVVGVLLLVWSAVRYRIVHRQISNQTFTPPSLSLTLLTIAIILMGAVSAIVLMLD